MPNLTPMSKDCIITDLCLTVWWSWVIRCCTAEGPPDYGEDPEYNLRVQGNPASAGYPRSWRVIDVSKAIQLSWSTKVPEAQGRARGSLVPMGLSRLRGPSPCLRAFKDQGSGRVASCPRVLPASGLLSRPREDYCCHWQMAAVHDQGFRPVRPSSCSSSGACHH